VAGAGRSGRSVALSFSPSFRSGDSFFFCTTQSQINANGLEYLKKKEKGIGWFLLSAGPLGRYWMTDFLACRQCQRMDDAKDRATAKGIGSRPTAISCVRAFFDSANHALCIVLSFS
jgi:hypothetical protein